MWLASQGFDVDAFDFSPIAIEKAKKLAVKHQVSVNFQCSDWEGFKWKAIHYDTIAGIFFQFADPEPRTYLQDADEGPGQSGMSSLVGFIGQKP